MDDLLGCDWWGNLDGTGQVRSTLQFEADELHAAAG
jgi:hypothetical protein